MADASDVITWIVGIINADTTLSNTYGLHGAWVNNSPEGTVAPAVIIQKQTGSHKYTMGREAYNRHWISVKCVDQSLDGGDRARSVMKRVKTLLNLGSVTMTSGTSMMFRADTDFEYGEQESGNVAFYHVGIVFVAWLGE